MKNTCLLLEIKSNQFFNYKNNIYKKIKDNVNDSCLCFKISFKKKSNESLKKLFDEAHLKSIVLSNKLYISKWNQPNFKLEIFNLNDVINNHPTNLIFNNFIYLNVDNLFRINMINDSIVHKLEINRLDVNKIHVGSISFDINDGNIDTNSFVFIASEKDDDDFVILDTMYKQLINITNDKKLIYQTAYNNNIFFDEINNINNKINEMDLIISVSANIKASLDIIYYCALKSIFYLALSNIRSIKNHIYDFIFDDFFIQKIESAKNIFDKFNENTESTSEEILQKIIHDSCIEKEIKNILKIFGKDIVSWHREYYKRPIYFFEMKFNDIKKNMFSISLNKKNKLVTDFLENKIVSKDFMGELAIANLLVNSSIHKNNYDTEHFESWYINENELKILTKTLKIFMDILYKYFEFKNKKLNS